MLGIRESKEDCDCVECQKKALRKEIKKLQAALSDLPFDRPRNRIVMISKITKLQARLDRLRGKKHFKHGASTSRSQPNFPTIPPLGLDTGGDP